VAKASTPVNAHTGLLARDREDRRGAVIASTPPAPPWPPFPRAIEADGSATALRSRLGADVRPLWRGAAVHVPVVRMDVRLEAALASAARVGGLVVGLEAAERALAREEQGLGALAARSQAARPVRISRLLLLASDGAERFYRSAERVLAPHAARVLGCRLDASARELGRVVLGHEAGVKAVLVSHKDAVIAVLRALAGAEAH
jgi:hypothetical protein